MIIEQIHIDKLELIPEWARRVITIDPTPYYEKVYSLSHYSHYKRYNTVYSETLFPYIGEKICACGCGKELTGRRKRWDSDDCRRFAVWMVWIISGRADVVRRFISVLHEEKCFVCEKTDNDFQRMEWIDRSMFGTISEYNNFVSAYEHDMANKIHLDHIVPVHQGGGCGWLNNYQFLCIHCHKEKSKKERIK